MAISPFFETWKGIGQAIGRSERWCRYMARRPDPLPVYKVGGVVRIETRDLEAWLDRERLRTLARDRTNDLGMPELVVVQ
jgi:hypothetical protein